jgi:hypothetical protein
MLSKTLVIASLLALLSTLSHAEDSGRFLVVEPEVQSSALRGYASRLQSSGVLQAVTRSLNQRWMLPTDIRIRLTECDESNAYYDAEQREVQMCIELVEDMASTLDGQFEEESFEADALSGAFVGMLLHEVGHALVDVLEIPITGREEDAVDQLSAWILIESGEADAVLGAAATYYGDDNGVGAEDFADEHSLNSQRYFNMVCWVYGSDADNRQDLIDTWELPQARAEQCADEYALLKRSWNRLLRGHMRTTTAQNLAINAPHLPLPHTSTAADDRSAPKPRHDDNGQERTYTHGLGELVKVRDGNDDADTTESRQRVGRNDRNSQD